MGIVTRNLSTFQTEQLCPDLPELTDISQPFRALVPASPRDL